MAYIGLANPVVAKLVSQSTLAGITTPTYSNAFKCGKAIKVNVTPNYNEAKLYADNQLAEYEKEFKDGTITLGTDRLPVQANATMFGHDVAPDGKKITYKAQDSGSYVGVGFYVDEILDGVKRYVASVVFKAKFAEAGEEYETKGDSIVFKTPSLEGAISALEDGRWKETQIFDTEVEAQEWIADTLGLNTAAMTVSPTTLSIAQGADDTATISNAVGTVNAVVTKGGLSTSDVTATVTGSTVTVEADSSAATGSDYLVTLTDANSNTATISVTVS